jgi:hypothetical protein
MEKKYGMKRMMAYVCGLVMMCCFTACGGGGGDDGETGGQGGGGGNTSSMSATIQADGAATLVTVTPLDCPIQSALAQDNWLSVEVVTYTSGSPVVKLTATSNPNTSERRTKVMIVGTSEAKVALTVTQKGKSATPSDDGTIEDTHETVTDQPAYAPERIF